jgi:hypothetical protein
MYAISVPFILLYVPTSTARRPAILTLVWYPPSTTHRSFRFGTYIHTHRTSILIKMDPWKIILQHAASIYVAQFLFLERNVIMILIYFEICHNSLDFAAVRGGGGVRRFQRGIPILAPGLVSIGLGNNKWNRKLNTMTYISAILKPCDPKLGMYEI